jgi:hypothetical protein
MEKHPKPRSTKNAKRSSRHRRQMFFAETSRLGEPGMKGGLLVLGSLAGVAVLGLVLLTRALMK